MSPSWRDQIEAARKQAESAQQATNEPNASDSPEAQLPGDVFPGFQVVRELHRGGQGIVYQAIESATERKVALKVLLHGPFASDAARHRFEREIKLAARLNHPHIITILQTGETTDGRQFYVMDYVRGEPLDRYLRENRVVLRRSLELFEKICAAVNHAHQRGVIHRDLKPSNILVESDGTPRIVDFGLAKQLAGAANVAQTMTGAPLGTLAFMSPEQVRGNPDEIDTRADVYGLGVVFYVALTGDFPYPVDAAIVDVLKHITDTPPQRPRRTWTGELGVRQSKSDSVNRSCPLDDELETILLKSLAKEPDRRYQFAGELGRDIRRYLDGQPIEAKGDSLGYRLRKAIRKHWIAAASLATYLLLVTVALTVALVALRQAKVAQKAEAEQRKIADEKKRLSEIQVTVLDNQNRRLQGGFFELVATAEGLVRSDELPRELLIDVNDSLAAAFSSASEYGKAIEYWEAAISHLDRNEVDDDNQRMDLEIRLAEAHVQGSQHERALVIFERLREEIEGKLPEDSSRRSRVLNDLALTYRYLSRLDEAEKIYNQALRDVDEDDMAGRLRLLGNLGALYYQKKDYHAAIEKYEQVYEARKELIKNSPENERPRLELQLLNARYNLAGNYTMIGELDKAERLLTESLAEARAVLRPGHDLIGHILLYYGRLKKYQGDPAAAREALEESLKINELHFGREHEWTVEVIELLDEVRNDSEG